MTNITVFVHCDKDSNIIETNVPENSTLANINGALKAVGVDVDDESYFFIDEEEHSYRDDSSLCLKNLKNGSHIHLCRCRKITVTINYLEQTAEHKFAPGVRVRRVKAWAVKHFKIEAMDAGEHVLRLCESTEVPATDTPLHTLTKFPECRVCFDFVPEERVEG